MTAGGLWRAACRCKSTGLKCLRVQKRQLEMTRDVIRERQGQKGECQEATSDRQMSSWAALSARRRRVCVEEERKQRKAIVIDRGDLDNAGRPTRHKGRR